MEPRAALASRPDRPSASVVALVAVAIVLGLAGGAVPGIEHAVVDGRLPEVLLPERSLGPPAAFSLSGRFAAVGAAIWIVIALAGLALRRVGPWWALGPVLTAAALSLLVNVALPLRFGGDHWSVLGVLQAGSISVASAIVVVDALRRRPRATGAPPTARA